MAERIPLGEPEHQRLEFKTREALRDPLLIARAVVGMLNAEGGDLWIGIREANGVAAEVEDVAQPDLAIRKLHDFLIETIEPPPRDEVQIIPVRDDSGRCLVLIGVRPRADRGPYAYRSRGGRHFIIRVGDRHRDMTREELFASGRTHESGAKAWTEVTEALERELVGQMRLTAPRLWLRLQPIGRTQFRPEREMVEWFSDPSQTGNRRTGWTFVDRHERAGPTPDGLAHGRVDYRRTLVRPDAGIEFSVPLQHLYWKGDHDMIWPFPLIEYPVSVFRLAAKVFRQCERPQDDRVATRLALLAAKGWKLKAGSPNTVQWLIEEPKSLDVMNLVSPIIEGRWQEIIDRPDRGAFPLVAAVYEGFGIFRDDIPHEFDPTTGLALPP